MPELPDITVYIERLGAYVQGREIQKARLASPFLVRTALPPLSILEGQTVRGFRRLGKRIVFEFDDELFAVLHLMVAGRLRWKPRGAKVPAKVGLLALDFEHGTLMLTEASSKKRASLYLVKGEDGLADHNRGGIEPLSADLRTFKAALKRENHTVKRALTDAKLFSGIGNAYSDEILHRARLPPTRWTKNLDDEAVKALRKATIAVLTEWTDKLRKEVGDGFPDKVTAFHEGMAVHGRHKKPCPDCGAPVQRIAYADNETNYCAACQNEGKLLKDRSLSRLLKNDWPKTLEELERN